jgi:hypothetical protein
MTGKRSQQKKRRKPIVISRTEAVRRLQAMVLRIEKDVKIALWAEATLEAANDIVTATPGRALPGAQTYNTISQSLTLNLAISLARLYDPGMRNRHPNKHDIASLPLIVRLLKQQRCQKVLVERARSWMPHMPSFGDIHARGCRRSIDGAIASYDGLRKTPEGRAIVQRLRDFRNKHLAHSMMHDTLEALPRYNELFKPMDIARDIVEEAKLAIDGLSMGLKDNEMIYRDQAHAFWKMALQVKGKED